MAETTVERRTVSPKTGELLPGQQQAGPSVNVLHKYRTFTYSFTLAALRKEEAFNPKTYRDSALDLVILKSGGKGPASIHLMLLRLKERKN